MRVGITGASSSIGGRVAVAAAEAGHEAIALVRSPGQTARRFDLAAPLVESVLDGLGAVVHLAWDWTPDRALSRRINADGSARLVEACASRGIPVVLLSTVSAYQRHESSYGALKAELEGRVAAAGGSSVRAGIVWGGQPGGILATIQRLASLPLVCPHLSPDPELLHSNVDALAAVLIAQAIDPVELPLPALATSREPVRLSSLVHSFGSGRSRLHVPAPVNLLRRVVAAAEAAHLPSPVRSDSLAAVSGGGLDLGADPQYVGDFAGVEALLSWAQSINSR